MHNTKRRIHVDRNSKPFILSVSEGKTFANYKRAMNAYTGERPAENVVVFSRREFLFILHHSSIDVSDSIIMLINHQQ